MRIFSKTLAACALCLSSAGAIQADTQAGITDQTYKSGKYSGAKTGNYHVIANCPREYRGIYRGNLYCRTPTYQLLQNRHPSCPKGFRGIYRGDLYCFGSL